MCIQAFGNKVLNPKRPESMCGFGVSRSSFLPISCLNRFLHRIFRSVGVALCPTASCFLFRSAGPFLFSLSAFLSRSFRCSCKKLAGMHRSLGRKYCSYQNGGNKFERSIFQTRFVAFAIGAMAILLRKTSPNSARKEAFTKRKLRS